MSSAERFRWKEHSYPSTTVLKSAVLKSATHILVSSEGIGEGVFGEVIITSIRPRGFVRKNVHIRHLEEDPDTEATPSTYVEKSFQSIRSNREPRCI